MLTDGARAQFHRPAITTKIDPGAKRWKEAIEKAANKARLNKRAALLKERRRQTEFKHDRERSTAEPSSEEMVAVTSDSG